MIPCVRGCVTTTRVPTQTPYLSRAPTSAIREDEPVVQLAGVVIDKSALAWRRSMRHTPRK